MAGYLAYIQIIDGGGGRPDNTLPGVPVFPAHPIAPGGQPPYPSQGPGFPTNPIAPGGQPVYPSQGLPGGMGGQPTHPIYFPQPPAGETKPPSTENLPPIVVWIPGLGWISAQPGTGPDNTLPGGSGGRPDQSLPGSQPHPDQSLPGGQPPRPGQPLPPTPEPKR